MRSVVFIGVPAALAVVALAIAALALPACGLAGFAWPNACPPAAAADAAERIDALAARRAALEGEIAALQRRVAALPDCPRVAAAAPPQTPEPPAPESQPEAEEAVTAAPPAARPEGLRPPAPPPETTPEPTPDAPIDEDRWRERDVSLLEGCWNLDSDYTMVDGRTGAPRRVASWTMCFDAQGVGRETQSFSGGVRCEGPVVGRFAGERLEIDELQDVPCSDGSVITRRRSRCTLVPGGRAACENFHPGIPDAPPVDITLRR